MQSKKSAIAPLFGIGGVLILVFFSIVWLWMKKVAVLDGRERTVAGFKLAGYLFWMNATWFLCGETGKLHLRAFAGDPAPSPIEIMVFLVFGWFFVLLGEYKSMRLKKSWPLVREGTMTISGKSATRRRRLQVSTPAG